MSSQQPSLIDSSFIPTDQTRSIQVIGVGLPRTGTKSFCVALQKLIEGQVCHAGSACASREEDFIKKWISILYPTPKTSHGPGVTLLKYIWLSLFPTWMLPVKGKLSEAKTVAKAEETHVKATLRDLLAGYVAAADAPILFFAGELAEIYPDAKIICTTRDTDKWWASYQELVGAIDHSGQDFINLLTPSLRYYLSWKLGIVERRKAIYHPDFEIGPDFMKVHEDYLRSVVPADRLFFFNVKDGWEPLCKILGCPIPNEPFPCVNDMTEMKQVWARSYRIGVTKWLKFILTPFTACAELLMCRRN